MKKLILKVTLTALTVIVIVVMGGSYYLLNEALTPDAMTTRAHNIEASYSELYHKFRPMAQNGCFF